MREIKYILGFGVWIMGCIILSDPKLIWGTTFIIIASFILNLKEGE